jgi:TusE/DsrC/DsvC family sulfur relay protein
MSALAAIDYQVPMTAEGYLLNAHDWTPELAQQLAAAEGIALTEEHWKVIEFCRQDYAARGEAPGIRRITKVGGIPTKQIYKLFPGGPGKLAARLSGLPKPTSCV